MTSAPANDTRQPANSRDGKPSWRIRPGEDRDQDRADVDEHGRCAGVDACLGGVQRHVVHAEPEDSADHDPREIAAAGEALAAGQDQQPEGDAADQQPPERERPGPKARDPRSESPRTPRPTARR